MQNMIGIERVALKYFYKNYTLTHHMLLVMFRCRSYNHPHVDTEKFLVRLDHAHRTPTKHAKHTSDRNRSIVAYADNAIHFVFLQ